MEVDSNSTQIGAAVSEIRAVTQTPGQILLPEAKCTRYCRFLSCLLPSVSCLLVKRKFWILTFVWLLASSFLPANAYPNTSSNCQEQDLEALTLHLLQDLPGYANRTTQRARRRNRTPDVYSYVLLAGRPEFAPLTLSPGEYMPAPASVPHQPQQVFITTLERQYTGGKAVELQEYHWLFLTQTTSGWRLAMMFSRTGIYPGGQPPTPPRDSSEGVIAQAIRTWLRDCQKND